MCFYQVRFLLLLLTDHCVNMLHLEFFVVVVCSCFCPKLLLFVCLLLLLFCCSCSCLCVCVCVLFCLLLLFLQNWFVIHFNLCPHICFPRCKKKKKKKKKNRCSGWGSNSQPPHASNRLKDDGGTVYKYGALTDCATGAAGRICDILLIWIQFYYRQFYL